MTTSQNKQPYTQDYYKVIADGSLRSARVILSELFLLCDVPQAVVDVGCGTGTWLLAAHEQGVTEFFGLDGNWVPPGQLKIPPERYVACDISAGSVLLASLPQKRFDLVISMEVAEHLPPDKARQFISFLSELGDVILFSAAIPGQGGQDQINEAWPAQWAELFAEHKFFCFDVLRSRVWMNPDVDWWYAQNVLIFARSESKTYFRLSQMAAPVDTPLPIVHPKQFIHLQVHLQDVNLRMDSVLKQGATLEADVIRLRAIEEDSRNLVNALHRVTAERDVALGEACEWKGKTSALLASWSWRVTAPLRGIADAFRSNRLSGGGLAQLSERLASKWLRRAINQPFLKVLGRAVLQPFPSLATRLYDLATAPDTLQTQSASLPLVHDISLLVNSFYKTAFGRPADPEGLAHCYQLKSGVPPEGLAEELVASAEFQCRHGSSIGVDTNYITALYRDGLGREPDPEELANWLAAGQNGATQGKVLAGIAGSAEALEKNERVPTTPEEERENLGLIPSWIYRLQRRRLASVKTARYVSLLSRYAKYPLKCRPRTSDDDAFRQIFIKREYRCLDDLREVQLIVDCGANVGFSSVYFLSRFPQAYVVAIEPDPGNFTLLKKNLARYKGRYTAICSAIWSHTTGLVFSEIQFRDGREWARVVREARVGERPMIIGTDIGTILRDSRFERISILKIDIELSEAAVFSANYENWLRKVDNLVIELHDDSCRAAFQNSISAENFTISQCEELVVCKRIPNLNVTAERDVALGEACEWKGKTSALLASWSWRVTAPLRGISDALRSNRLSGGGLAQLSERLASKWLRRAINQPFLKVLGRAVLQPFPSLATRLYDLATAPDTLQTQSASLPLVHDISLLVNSFYKTAFGRPADPQGLARCIHQLKSGVPPEGLAEELVASAEFQCRHGSSIGVDTNYITALYRDGLGREPDPEGLANWLAVGERGATRAKVLAGFARSAEALCSRKRAYTTEWVSSLCSPDWPRHHEFLELSDASLRDLREVRGLGAVPNGEVPLITVVHNEMPRLPDFLRHYRELGVRRFIIVDHCSDDETSDYLVHQPDVHLYRAQFGYHKTVSGQMWITGLARRFARGRWVLHVDADEHLVYEGMESHGIIELSQKLESRGETRLYAPMLDMYPSTPIAEARLAAGTKLVDLAPYFDPFSHDGFTFYERITLPGQVTLRAYNRIRSFGDLIGSDYFIMDKFPLSKWHDRTAYCWIHRPFPFDENLFHQFGTLLHFRFLGNFVEFNRSIDELGEAWDGGLSYRKYADKVVQEPQLSLYHAGSRHYRGPCTAISEGFMEPIDWS